MANVKEILISAIVPFDFLLNAQTGDAALLGRLLLTPGIGIRHSYIDAGWRPNPETKGQTKLCRLSIVGMEALNFRYLDHLKEALLRMGAIIDRWEIVDIEAGG